MAKRKRLKAFSYVRVSTKMQAEEGCSFDNQRREIQEYAEGNKMKLVRTYADEGKSGKSITGRPQFMEMLQAIKDGEEIDYVIVYSLSRFGRNAADAATSLQALEDYGVKLHCIKEFLGSAGAIGNLMIQISRPSQRWSATTSVKRQERADIRKPVWVSGTERRLRSGIV